MREYDIRGYRNNVLVTIPATADTMAEAREKAEVMLAEYPNLGSVVIFRNVYSRFRWILDEVEEVHRSSLLRRIAQEG